MTSRLIDAALIFAAGSAFSFMMIAIGGFIAVLGD